MFTKLFSSILNSSIWSEDAATCKVWITLLAMMDSRGFIFGSVLGIARIAALPVETVEQSMQRFLGADPHSTDLTRNGGQGQRIEVVQGGWRVINADYYRDLQDADERREREKLKKRRRRAKRPLSPVVPPCPPLSPSVPKCPHLSPHTESESESESESVKKEGGGLEAKAEIAMGQSDQANKAEDIAQGGKRREPETLKELPEHLNTARMQNKWRVWMNQRRAFKKPGNWAVLFNGQIEWLAQFSEPEVFEMLSASIRNGWQGLYEPKKRQPQERPKAANCL